MNSVKPSDIPYKLLGQMTQGASLNGLSNDDIENSAGHIAAVTVHITTLYYSALTNLFLQSLLPSDVDIVEAEMPRVKIAINRSYTDFIIAKKWLTKNGGDFIATSPAKQYYDEVLGLGYDSIKDITGFYSE